jgi:hypothetical protein
MKTDTGFKDKNGNPIRVGDMIEEYQTTESGPRPFLREVVWHAAIGGFGLKNLQSGYIRSIAPRSNHLYFKIVKKTNERK